MKKRCFRVCGFHKRAVLLLRCFALVLSAAIIFTLPSVYAAPARVETAVTAVGHVDQAIKLKVGLYKNAPKIYTDQDGRAAGFWPDLLRYIAEEEGWEIEWVPGTWDQGLQRLEKNQIDIMPDVGWTPQRAERFAFSKETVLLSWSRLYARKGTDIQSILDLEGKTIAALTGSVNLEGPEGIRELTKEFEIDCTIIGMDDYRMVFEALERGEIDAGVTNKDFGSRHEGDYSVERTAIVFQPARILFAFTKDAGLTPYLIERVDAHMQDLKADNDSIYYLALEEHIGGKVAETVIEIIPAWVKKAFIMSAGVLVFLMAVVAVFRILVRRRTAELQASETRNRNLLESIPDLIFKFNHKGEILDYQAKDQSLFYVPAEEFIGQKVSEVMPPEIAGATMENIQRALESGEQQSNEYPLSIDGEQRYYEARYIPGGKKEVTAIVRDITKRKQADKQVQFLSSVVEQSADGMAIADLEGNLLFVNNAWANMHGYNKAAELLGKHLSTFHNEEQLMSEVEPFNRKVMEKGFNKGEIGHIRKDGTVFPTHMTTVTLKDENGNPIALSAIATDITDRELAQEALRESEEKYRAVFDNTGTATVILEEDTTISLTNKRFEELSGYSAEEIEGKMNWTDFVVEEDLERMKKYHDSRREKGQEVPTRYEFRFIDRKKQIHNIFLEVEVIPGTKRSVASLLDITEQARNIEQIKRSSNLINALREVGLGLVSKLDVDELLEDVVLHAVDLVNGVGGSISVLDPERQVLKMGGQIGFESIPEDTTIKRGEGLIGQVWAKREMILIEDYEAWEDHAPQWVDHIGHRAAIGIPVMREGEILGVIEIFRESDKPFSEEDAWLLEMFANQAAVAIYNANLFNFAERRLKRLQALREIEQAISGSLDLRITLDVLVDRLIKNLEVDAVAILLYHSALQTLEFITGSGFRSDAPRHTSLRIGEGYTGRAALEREIVHIPNLTLETVKFEQAKLIRQEEFVAYFGVPLITKGEIVGVLEIFHRSPLDPLPEWIDFLNTAAGQAAIAIDRLNLFNGLERSNMDLNRAYNDVIEGWARALELRDRKTEGHSRRVEELTLAIARKMGIEKEKLAHIRQGALLHDIGKIGIPDSILQKPGKLTEEEWEVMKKHPIYAYEVLNQIDHLKPALDIPRYHHERWDGSGYPEGLKGKEIPLAARIFAVVDVWDALRSDRPYREAWPDEKALEHIKEESGKHFDPRVVEVFLEILGGE